MSQGDNSHITTRGMYPNNVSPNEVVFIPPLMGKYSISLDDGGFDAALFGFIYVIIDQRGTDGDAIKAAHRAFDTSSRSILTDFIKSKLTSEDKSPTDEEKQDIANAIQASVIDAAKEASDIWDFFDGRDRTIGFGSQFFDYADLVSMSSGTRNVRNVASPIWIKSQNVEIKVGRTYNFVSSTFQTETITIIRNYDLFGWIHVAKPKRPFGYLGELLDQYDQAVKAYKDVNSDISNIHDKLDKAKKKEREELLLELNHTRDFTKKAARRDVLIARSLYDNCRKGFQDGPYRENELQRDSILGCD